MNKYFRAALVLLASVAAANARANDQSEGDELLKKADAAYQANDVANADKLYVQACAQNNAVACVRAANFEAPAGGWEEGSLMKIRADSLYRKACDLSPQGCILIAERYDYDYKLAEPYWAKACDQNSGEGCVGMAKMLEARGDEPNAHAARQKSCDLDYIAGCNEVANSFIMANYSRWSNGGDPPPEPSKQAIANAEAAAKKACNAKSSSGCANLAYIYDDPVWGKDDGPGALRFVQLACEYKNDEDDGCLGLTSNHVGELRQ